MKVKLSLGETDIVGYKNINPFTEFDNIYDNSATLIYICNEVLSNINNNIFEDFIKKIISKARIGGEIIISGVDFYQLCTLYITKECDELFISQILNGSKGFYKCKLVIDELSKYVSIKSVCLDGYIFSVIGERVD